MLAGWLAAAVLVAFAAPAASASTAERWQAELTRVHDLLRESQWVSARQAAGALVAELLGDLKGGPAAAELLAAAYAQRALADAGLGEQRTALWSLAIAGCLDEVFASAPLAGFGDASSRLAGWRRPPAREPLPLATPGLVPPRVIASPTIVFRASAEVLRAFDRSLEVELVVDEEGRPRRPRVRGSRGNPAPVALSLEVLADWRFEPARLGDAPVPVTLTLPLPLTRAAAERVRQLLSADGSP